jgi:hypothetical protein
VLMHAATEIRDNSVKLRRATCAVHKRADKRIEAEGGIFEKCVVISAKLNYRKSSPQKLMCYCDNKCIKMM